MLESRPIIISQNMNITDIDSDAIITSPGQFFWTRLRRAGLVVGSAKTSESPVLYVFKGVFCATFLVGNEHTNEAQFHFSFW